MWGESICIENSTHVRKQAVTLKWIIQLHLNNIYKFNIRVFVALQISGRMTLFTRGHSNTQEKLKKALDK
jgi:hypothetical protein